ncbi:MAG: recombinase family protein [Bacilli bacterium]|nr:recombinase family protein [Bacilli bacterium]
MKKEVEKIEASTKLPSLKKVAAYARVSSGKEAMLQSLSAQISDYNRMIQSHEEWAFVGVYSDEAMTGTKDSREGFQQLIKDAIEGKIDLIITKSISRFARNTLTLLETTRELKQHNVNVYFEEERIYSMSNEGEMILSMLASVAQEQSRSTSENMLWRIKKDMEQGILWGGNNCLGYKMINRRYVIDPETAPLVQRIFHEYIAGKGAMRIAKAFNDEGIKSFKGTKWTRESVLTVLSNINYTGDLVLQKTFRENHLTKTTKCNKGQKNMYLVEKDHEPIITKAVWNEAQRIRRQKAEKVVTKNIGMVNKFTGLLYCGYCGKRYMKKQNRYRIYWNCRTFENFGKEACSSRQIRDDMLMNITTDILGLKEFDENKVRNLIERIEIFSNENRLLFHLKDGTTKEATYPEYSRRNSWTPEMREVARQRTLKMNERRKKQ